MGYPCNGIKIKHLCYYIMTLQWDALPLKIAASQAGFWTSYLLHGSLSQLESTTQTASRSVQPFLQGHYLDRQTDRQTTLLGL